MARGKEDNPANVPMLRVEVRRREETPERVLSIAMLDVWLVYVSSSSGLYFDR